MEEEAIFYLSQMANENHKLRSAFTCGPICGSIYLEALMDPSLYHLLNLTPGVIRTRQGIVSHAIDPSDWVQLLTMEDPRTKFQLDRWGDGTKGAIQR